MQIDLSQRELLLIYQALKYLNEYYWGDKYTPLVERGGDLSIRILDHASPQFVLHFKRDVMPAWFVRRWPVKYNTVTLVLCCNPDLKTHSLPHVEISQVRPDLHFSDYPSPYSRGD